MIKKYIGIFLVAMFCVYPTYALQISEVNFDPVGSDSGREWIEIFNESAQQIDLTTYYFFQGNSNHGIDVLTGDKNIGAGEYVVLVQDFNKFKVDYPAYTGKIYKANFSLVNTGESLGLKSSKTNIVNTINYSLYLSGIKEGETVNFDGANYFKGSPSPGTIGVASTNQTTDTSVSTTTNPTTATTTTNISTTTSYYSPTYFYRSYYPESEKTYTNAGENRTGISGAAITFIGNCVNGDKKIMSGTNYFWSFGDGASAEGKETKHIYKFPGEYTVDLETYVNGYKSTDTIFIKISDPDLKINLQNIKGDMVVELNNNGLDVVDLGEFLIKTSGGEFSRTSTLPKRLSILPHRSVKIPQEILSFATSTNFVSLNYPGGKTISEFKYIPKVENGTTGVTISTTTKVATLPLKRKLTFQPKIKETVVTSTVTGKVAVDNENKFVIKNESVSWFQTILSYLTK